MLSLLKQSYKPPPNTLIQEQVAGVCRARFRVTGFWVTGGGAVSMSAAGCSPPQGQSPRWEAGGETEQQGFASGAEGAGPVPRRGAPHWAFP